MTEASRTRRKRGEWTWTVALGALGVGTRLALQSAFPTLPFWDFLQIVHFGTLLRDHGLAASGWYWSAFNPGLPVILSVLFRLFPGDPIAIARTATAAATGLVPLLPFFLWRGVVRFRWRLLAGLLLALWPGQIFFAGAVAQDNWVLVPTVALACLAVRALRDPRAPGHPIVGGLLYVCAFAIRQEMGIVLLPVVLAAVLARKENVRRTKNLVLLALVVGAALVLLAAQRRAATGRFALTTRHGTLSLFGSFMPGAAAEGWIDGRAYAEALVPGSLRETFGSQATLVRLTLAEARRRPAFHLLRVAAWVPRLAINADVDDLFWSLGAPRAQSPDRQARAVALGQRWIPRMKVELALVQGLFLAALALGLWRRDPAILVLSATVFLKFLIHALVAPVGRVAVPAIALELLVIPLGASMLADRAARTRWVFGASALAAAVFLLLAVPALTALVIRHDSPILPGVERFTLHAGDCDVRCALESGAVSGLGPSWAQIQTAGGAPARVRCALPLMDSQEGLLLRLRGDESARIELDGRPVAVDGAGAARLDYDARIVTIEKAATESSGSGAIRFDFERAVQPSSSGR